MPTVSTTQQQDVTIATVTEARLMQRLKAWEQVRQEIAALEQTKAALVAEIEEIRAREVGVASFNVNGFRVTRVEGTHTTFDKKAFVTLGGDLRLYEAACVTKPKKPYTTIAGPKDGE